MSSNLLEEENNSAMDTHNGEISGAPNPTTTTRSSVSRANASDMRDAKTSVSSDDEAAASSSTDLNSDESHHEEQQPPALDPLLLQKQMQDLTMEAQDARAAIETESIAAGDEDEVETPAASRSTTPPHQQQQAEANSSPQPPPPPPAAASSSLSTLNRANMMMNATATTTTSRTASPSTSQVSVGSVDPNLVASLMPTTSTSTPGGRLLGSSPGAARHYDLTPIARNTSIGDVSSNEGTGTTNGARPYLSSRLPLNNSTSGGPAPLPIKNSHSRSRSLATGASHYHLGGGVGGGAIISPEESAQHHTTATDPLLMMDDDMMYGPCSGVLLSGEHLALPSDLSADDDPNMHNANGRPQLPPLLVRASRTPAGTMPRRAYSLSHAQLGEQMLGLRYSTSTSSSTSQEQHSEQQHSDLQQQAPPPMPEPVPLAARKFYSFTSRQQYEEALAQEERERQAAASSRGESCEAATTPTLTPYQPSRRQDFSEVGAIPEEELNRIFIPRRRTSNNDTDDSVSPGEAQKQHRLVVAPSLTSTGAAPHHILQNPIPMDDRQYSIPSLRMAHHLGGATTTTDGGSITSLTVEDEESLLYLQQSQSLSQSLSQSQSQSQPFPLYPNPGGVVIPSGDFNHAGCGYGMGDYGDDASLSSIASSCLCTTHGGGGGTDDEIWGTGEPPAAATEGQNNNSVPALPTRINNNNNNTTTIVMDDALAASSADATAVPATTSANSQEAINPSHSLPLFFPPPAEHTTASSDNNTHSSSTNAAVDGDRRREAARRKRKQQQREQAYAWLQSVKGQGDQVAEAASSKFLTQPLKLRSTTAGREQHQQTGAQQHVPSSSQTVVAAAPQGCN